MVQVSLIPLGLIGPSSDRGCACCPLSGGSLRGRTDRGRLVYVSVPVCHSHSNALVRKFLVFRRVAPVLRRLCRNDHNSACSQHLGSPAERFFAGNCTQRTSSGLPPHSQQFWLQILKLNRTIALCGAPASSGLLAVSSDACGYYEIFRNGPVGSRKNTETRIRSARQICLWHRASNQNWGSGRRWSEPARRLILAPSSDHSASGRN